MEAESRLAARYVDGRYLDANPTWHDEDAPDKAGWVFELLTRHPEIPHASVCDVGCGTGGVLESLQRGLGHGVRVTGFEPSVGALRIAHEKRPGLHIVGRGATGDDGPFDVALVLDVFEHIEDYLGFLRGLQGLARSFIFNIPLDMTVYNLLRPRELQRIRETLGHLHHFSTQTALATLRATGYDVIDSRYVLVAGNRLRRLAWKLAPDLSARMIGGVSLLVLASGETPRI